MGNNRLYPISEEVFNRKVLPVIEGIYIGKGRPPKVSPYQVFCAIRYIAVLGGMCPKHTGMGRCYMTDFPGEASGEYGRRCCAAYRRKG
jgi:hypothetical protein